MAWPDSISLDVAGNFSQSYAEARDKFREACGSKVESYENPAHGPDGISLTTDVALFGPRDAEKLVAVVSGTHGPEGFAGSGCQIGWVSDGGPAAVPEGVAVLLIHLINPWGTAWGRRQTEANVDLNRNFLDFSQPLPKNELYTEIRNAIHCPDPNLTRAAIDAFTERHGQQGLAQALFKGQYEDSRGVGFGGQGPVWSNRTFRQILVDYAHGAKTVAVIDLHTGYGPYGYGMLLNADEADSSELALARQWFGESVIGIKAEAGGVPYSVSGDLGTGARDALPDATVISIAIEYGTYAVDRLLYLQIDDCWLLNHGDPSSPEGLQIREELCRFFYPEMLDWRQMVHARAQQVIGQAI